MQIKIVSAVATFWKHLADTGADLATVAAFSSMVSAIMGALWDEKTGKIGS